MKLEIDEDLSISPTMATPEDHAIGRTDADHRLGGCRQARPGLPTAASRPDSLI
jgi:hypothetical protein